MKKAIFVICVIVLGGYISAGIYSYDLRRPAKKTHTVFFTAQELLDSSTKIQKHTIWFGSKLDSADFLVTTRSEVISGKKFWMDKNELYHSRNGKFEKIQIPERDDYSIYDLSGIAGRRHSVLIELLFETGDKRTYQYDLQTKKFTLLTIFKRKRIHYIRPNISVLFLYRQEYLQLSVRDGF